MLSVVCGIVLGFVAGEHDGRAVRVLWFRLAWLLHLPWISIGLCAVVATLVAWRESVNGGDALVVENVSGTGFVIWAVASLGIIVAWGLWFERRSRTLCLSLPNTVLAAVAVCAIALLAFNAYLGLLGGITAMEGAIGLFGLPSPWEEF